MASLASTETSAAARGEPIDSSSLRALWSEADEVVSRDHQQQHHHHHGGQQQQQQADPSHPLHHPQSSMLYDSARDPLIGLADRGDANSGLRTQRSSAYLQNPVGSPSSTRMASYMPSPGGNGRASPSAQRYSPQSVRMPQYSDNLARLRGDDGNNALQGDYGQGRSTSPNHPMSAKPGAAGSLAVDGTSPFDPLAPSTSPDVALRNSNPQAYAQALLHRQPYRGAAMQHGGPDGAFENTLRPEHSSQHTSPLAEQPQSTGFGASDDQLFFHRDPVNAVRRNHTIATESRPAQKRLDQHFLQVSPSKNSLSAITGGVDGEDDLEAILKRRQSLLPPAADDEPNGVPSIWSTSAVTSSHRRYPSQPVSTLATSPLIDPTRPIDGSSSVSRGEGSGSSSHHRSESAHLTGLDHGSFASSPIVLSSAFNSSSGLLRRHQSLNYHLGRNAAARHLGHVEGQEARPLFQQPASPLGLVASGSQNTQSSVPMQHASSTASFPESIFREPISPYQARQTGQSQFDNDTQLAPSLMEAHARLARMSIMPSEPTSVASGMPASSTSQNQSMNDGGDIESLRRLPSLVTDRDVLARASESADPDLKVGPATAAPYVPSIGQSHFGQGAGAGKAGARSRGGMARNAPRSAHPGTGDWMSKQALAGRQHERITEGEAAQASQQSSSPASFGTSDNTTSGIGSQEQQYVQQQHQLFLQQQQMYHLQQLQQLRQLQQVHAATTMLPQGFNAQQPAPIRLGMSSHAQGQPGNHMHWKQPEQGMYASMPAMAGQILPHQSIQPGAAGQLAPSPMPAGQLRRQMQPQGINAETRELMNAKGLNPPPHAFDVNATQMRCFVIKSYTEDDVFRSLKHGIWASTEKGNQRLDRAFKESHSEGPIYLLFSCNGSGHFCGVARMLSEVDYNTSASIWSEEGKWKGTFKVQWIYVKDIPNGALRHIRLTNTAECKPMVQSRDTQELPSDGGRAALKIFTEYPSRTTLMQDWSFYEQQAQAKEQLQNKGRSQQPPQSGKSEEAVAVAGAPEAAALPAHASLPCPPPKSSRRRGGRGGHGTASDANDVTVPT